MILKSKVYYVNVMDMCHLAIMKCTVVLIANKQKPLDQC